MALPFLQSVMNYHWACRWSRDRPEKVHKRWTDGFLHHSLAQNRTVLYGALGDELVNELGRELPSTGSTYYFESEGISVSVDVDIEVGECPCRIDPNLSIPRVARDYQVQTNRMPHWRSCCALLMTDIGAGSLRCCSIPCTSGCTGRTGFQYRYTMALGLQNIAEYTKSEQRRCRSREWTVPKRSFTLDGSTAVSRPVRKPTHTEPSATARRRISTWVARAAPNYTA